MDSKKRLNMITIISVVLTGAGFGALAGLGYVIMMGGVYAQMLGAGLGAASGYTVARLYLDCLSIIFGKGFSRFKSWALCTLTAVICGVLCTAFIHTVLIFALVKVKLIQWPAFYESSFWFFIIVVEIIGALAGLIVGGVLSHRYVLMEDKDETNELP